MKSIYIIAVLVFSFAVTNSQNVGIGTTTPAGRLHIKAVPGSSPLIIDASAFGSTMPFINLRSSNGNDRMHLYADSSVNVFIGIEAGKNNTITASFQGLYNTAIGSQALKQNQYASNSTALGYRALYLSTGDNNTAVGSLALSENTTGRFNTAIGSFSLSQGMSGSDNVAVGNNALRTNTSGDLNVAVGSSALYSNTSGFANIAIGGVALSLNTWGSGNIAIGNAALANAVNTSANIAIGTDAMKYSNSGYDNTAVGYSAMKYTTSGSENTAVGIYSLFNTVGGYYNVAVGKDALFNNKSGSRNIAVGTSTGTASGYDALNNTIGVGNHDILHTNSNVALFGNFGIVWNGGNVPWGTYSDERIKTNIANDVKGLEFILKLKPVTYNRNFAAALQLTGNKEMTESYPEKLAIEKIKFTGFLAQDVEKAAKEVGYDFSGVQAPRNSNGLYTLSYETFVVPLVKAVQEQQTIIEELKQEIKKLQGSIQSVHKQ